MAKKNVGIMIFLCVVLAGAIIYIEGQEDHTGPEIIADSSSDLVYSPDMSEAELLEGISAVDEKDGDVSDTLTVESVYETDDSSVVISYAAKDNDNNITKYKRTMKAENTEEDEEGEDSPAEENGSSEETAENTEDVSEESGEETEETVAAPTATPKQDEAESLRQEQEALADAMPSQNPRIYLTEYLVKIPVGSSWEPLDYVSEIEDDQDDMYALWRKIQVSGSVDTSAAGTYECTYNVMDSQNNDSNHAVIKVIVE